MPAEWQYLKLILKRYQTALTWRDTENKWSPPSSSSSFNIYLSGHAPALLTSTLICLFIPLCHTSILFFQSLLLPISF